MRKKIILPLLTFFILLPEISVKSQEQQSPGIQQTIQEMTSDVKSMTELAGNAKVPVKAYQVLKMGKALIENAKPLSDALDNSLKKNEKMAAEFKQKAVKFSTEPKKAKFYSRKSLELLEQADHLSLRRQELISAIESLKKQIERIECDPAVKQLIKAETGKK